jgi:hypothetical protein
MLMAASIVLGQSEGSEQLSGLQWWIGDWVCEQPLPVDIEGVGKKGDLITIAGSHKWTLRGKAIQMNWTNKINGKTVNSGRALIGWDGTSNKIMEWAVTLEGNHSGEWRRDGEDWVYALKGFGLNGPFSADLVYTNIEADSFTSVAKNWVIGGVKKDESEFHFKRVEKEKRRSEE